MAKSSKGSAYERTICKALSLWWTQDLEEPRDDIYWRTSQSGGRATTRRKQNIDTAYSQGDITFIDPIGAPFIDMCLLELKRGYSKDLDTLNFIDKLKGEPLLIKWWKKAEQERKECKRKWSVIIFRRDRHKSCIMLNTSMLKKIESLFGKCPNDFIIIKHKKFNFLILKLDSFLSWVHPKFFDGL